MPQKTRIEPKLKRVKNMVISILKKMFGPDGQAEPEQGKEGTVEATGDPNLQGFVEYAVRSLVDNPDQVNIAAEEDGDTVTFNVTCEKSDIGKVIGKKGKTISAIRVLTNGAAGKIGLRARVEVLD